MLVKYISHSRCTKNACIEHTHTPSNNRILGSPCNAHVLAQLQQSMLPSLQASTALSQSAAEKMLKQQLKWAWYPWPSQRTSCESQGSEQAMRRLPKNAPGISLLPVFIILHSLSFFGAHKPVLEVQIGHTTHQ